MTVRDFFFFPVPLDPAVIWSFLRYVNVTEIERAPRNLHRMPPKMLTAQTRLALPAPPATQLDQSAAAAVAAVATVDTLATTLHTRVIARNRANARSQPLS